MSSQGALLKPQFRAKKNSPLPLAHVLSANGAVRISKSGPASRNCVAPKAGSHYQPGAPPQGSEKPPTLALKARFTFWTSLIHDWRHAPITQ
jgi:hypothetical protein